MAFQPLAALIRYYRYEIDDLSTYNFNADKAYIAGDGDTISTKTKLLFHIILNGLQAKNKILTFKDLLEEYYYLPLKDDFFESYSGDLTLLERTDIEFDVQNTVKDILTHIFTLKQNGETATAIRDSILNIYNDLCFGMNNIYIKEFLNYQLTATGGYIKAGLLFTLMTQFGFYEKSHGQFIYNSLTDSYTELRQTKLSENKLTIFVEKGWNCISELNQKSTIADNNILIENTLFEFGTQFKSAEFLEIGKGYWVKAQTSGMIEIIPFN